MKYHYKDAAGHEVGPISEEELHAFRAGGLLVDETLVKPTDTETWTSYAAKFGPMLPTNASSRAGTRLTRKQWLAIGAVASLVAIFYGGSIVADAVLNRTPPSAVVSPGISASIPQQFSQFEISKTEVVFDNSGALVSGHAQVTLTLKEPFYAKDDFMRRLVEKGDDPNAFESALARRDKLPPPLAPVIPNGPSSQLFAEAKPRGYQTTATATLAASKQSRQWTFTDCVNAWVGHRGWVLARVDWPPLPPEFTGLAPRGQLPRTAVLLNEEPGQSALRALLAGRQKFIADVRTAEEFVAQQEAHYRKAMTQARESLDAGRFADSRKFIAAALLSKPDDISARNLLVDISGAEKKARDARIAAGEQVLPEAGETWENTLRMKFVSVPGVNVLFGIWDVRVQDYQAFVTATHREWPVPRFEQGATHPAVNVNWDDAHAFCAWLTQTEHAAGGLAPNQRYRLPTDWEWSVAVGLDESHGGTPQSKSMQIRGVFPWGSEWPPPRGAGNYAANLNVDNFANASPVGSFAANRYGLFDMGGNVWQWCDDFYDGRSGVLAVRGGSFDWSDPGQLLASFRGRPSYPRYFNIGFRCVVEVRGGPEPLLSAFAGTFAGVWKGANGVTFQRILTINPDLSTGSDNVEQRSGERLAMNITARLEGNALRARNETVQGKYTADNMTITLIENGRALNIDSIDDNRTSESFRLIRVPDAGLQTGFVGTFAGVWREKSGFAYQRAISINPDLMTGLDSVGTQRGRLPLRLTVKLEGNTLKARNETIGSAYTADNMTIALSADGSAIEISSIDDNGNRGSGRLNRVR